MALAAGTLAPPAVFAQKPPALRRIGFINLEKLPPGGKWGNDLVADELQKLGYVEGKSFVMETRDAKLLGANI